MDRESVLKKMKDYKIPDETIEHGKQVCDLALKIAARIEEKEKVNLDYDHIITGAIIHDAGFIRCKGNPISISLLGKKDITVPADVILHGMYGAEIAKEMGFPEAVSLIVLRHELFAITRDERAELGILPLPPEDVVPITWEEKAVMYADGLVFLGIGLDLDPWNDPEAPAKGFFDFLKSTAGHLSKEPIALSHSVLERANRLNAEMKGYANPDWISQ
jgi:putative nucleotidyltransferase with HDIG domain